MKAEITHEFIKAVTEGARELRDAADELESNEHCREEGTVGEVIREAVESKRQTADLLTGWVERIERKIKNGT